MERNQKARILFLTLDDMGWATYASTLIAATDVRSDIDAVHIRFPTDGIKRLLSLPVPGGRGLLDAHVRRVLVAKRLVHRWLAGPLDLRRFDAIHVTPQQYGLGFVDAVRNAGPVLSVLLDATVFQAKGELMGQPQSEVRRHYRPLIEAEQAVFDAATVVVAMSTWAANGVRDGFGIADDKLLVLPISVPRPLSGPQQIADPVHRPPRIVFVGADFTRKGGDRLLAWHQERWADTAELHLCTPHPPARGLRNVHHHGPMPHDELLQHVLPSMDLLVLPTRKDMSPWAVLEGAAVGLPVVSSAIGGIDQMVLDGTTGYLRAPDDDHGFIEVIDRLLADPLLRARMGAAALRHIGAQRSRRSSDDILIDRLVEIAD